MLKKTYRLPIQTTLKKKGRVEKGRYFLFVFFPKEKEHPRYGVSVPKKLYPKAVDRNAMRRMLYDAIQSAYEKGQQEADMLVRLRKSVMNNEENHAMIDELTHTICSKHSS